MKITITAPNAIIRTDASVQGGSKKKRNRKRNKGNGNGNGTNGNVETANFATTRAMPSHVESMLSEKFTLDADSEGWLHHYMDPCGVGQLRSDCRRVPDGALPFSAEAEFLFLETITMPMNSLQITDTSGKNFSLLCLQQPMMRAGAILLCHIQSKEFNDVVMSSFARAFAAIASREAAYYPNWVPCDLFDIIDGVVTPVLFFTVLTPTALRAIGEPNENGISTFLSQFRFTSYGVDINHNTPTLFDQGTFVTGCFNASVSTYTYDENHVRGFDPFFLTVNNTASNTIFANAQINGVSSPPINELNYSGTMPSPGIELTFGLRNPAGTVYYPAGTIVSYRLIGNAVQLVDVTGTIAPLILGTHLIGNIFDKRLYARIDNADAFEEPIISGSNTFNLFTLPPVTQADVQQMNVSAVHGLLKGNRDLAGANTKSGCYLANRIWQPIFNVQNASSFRKCLIVNEDTDLQDLTNNSDGWKDSFDLNYGWGVMNLQAVPWAAAPFIHLVRTDEQVPGHNSILGAYARRAGYKQPLASDIALSASSRLPHGYTMTHEGTRKMFNAICKTLGTIPRLLANTSNVGEAIGKLIDSLPAA